MKTLLYFVIAALAIAAATLASPSRVDAQAAAPAEARVDRSQEWTLALEGVASAHTYDFPPAPALIVGRRFGRTELSLVFGYGLQRNVTLAGSSEHALTTRLRVGFALAETPIASLLVIGEFGYAGEFERAGNVRVRTRSAVAFAGLRGSVYAARWLSLRGSIGASYSLVGGTEIEGREHYFAFIHPLATLGMAAHW